MVVGCCWLLWWLLVVDDVVGVGVFVSCCDC